jgi:hypothetical protein
MNRKIDLFSLIIVLLGIAFYYWILGAYFPGKKIILSVLILLNSIGLITNIKYFSSYRKATYVSYMGYLGTMAFVAITMMLQILELVK